MTHKFRTAEDYRDHLPCVQCQSDAVDDYIGNAIREVFIGNKSVKFKDLEDIEFDKMPLHLTGDKDFDDVLEECIDIMASKGHDYMAGTEDRLYNFRQAAKELDISMREVVYIYLWKHLAAIRSYCKTGEVRSEDLKGRISDAINYMLILYKVSLEEK